MQDSLIGQVMPTTVTDVAALPLHEEKRIEMPVFDPYKNQRALWATRECIIVNKFEISSAELRSC